MMHHIGEMIAETFERPFELLIGSVPAIFSPFFTLPCGGEKKIRRSRAGFLTNTKKRLLQEMSEASPPFKSVQLHLM